MHKIKLLCVSDILYRFLVSRLHKSLAASRLVSFKTKSKKLLNLKSNIHSKPITYSVSVINLSDDHLTKIETQKLSLGLKYCFVDKNKYVKKNLASNYISDKVTNKFDTDSREDFHEFLRAYTDIFTKNV